MRSQKRYQGRIFRKALRTAENGLTLAAILLASALSTAQAVKAPGYKEQVLYQFKGSQDGGNPYAGLILDTAGNLYGATTGGGSNSCAGGCGTVFRIDATGNETVLYRFAGGTDGSYPYGGLILDSANNLYGTTLHGGGQGCGGAGCGTVFKLDTSGSETVLYSFAGQPADGEYPQAALVMDASGNLYGTTVDGGSQDGGGVVFKLDTAGNETLVHVFTGSPDGWAPLSALIIDTAGNLYGTTELGGDSKGCDKGHGCGIAFQLVPAGKETILHAFEGDRRGRHPYAGLVMDANGSLYGTTEEGAGTVFKLSSSGVETVLHDFNYNNGAQPYDQLILDMSGNLYGTTRIGGNRRCGGYGLGCGVVFKLDPNDKETLLHIFGQTIGDGVLPYAGVVEDPEGNLYGTTWAGGDPGCNCGVVYKLAPNEKSVKGPRFPQEAANRRWNKAQNYARLGSNDSPRGPRTSGNP
jgi:uncharacterized repeat protein (TIGR03803 family)